jgi:hypothetical protein
MVIHYLRAEVAGSNKHHSSVEKLVYNNEIWNLIIVFTTAAFPDLFIWLDDVPTMSSITIVSIWGNLGEFRGNLEKNFVRKFSIEKSLKKFQIQEKSEIQEKSTQ